MDADGQAWGLNEELLAGLIEVLDAVGWRIAAPYLKKSYKPKLLHVPRPHETRPETERRPATLEELEAMFGPVNRPMPEV